MDLPGARDGLLQQNARRRLFDALVELRRAAGTDELADLVGLHPNGVRLHLDRMYTAGLLERRRVRQAVGRPRDVWAIAPGAHPGSVSPRPYRDLARWLVRAMQSRRGGRRSVEATGRDVGFELAAPTANDPPEQQLQDAFAALGFAPEQIDAPAGRASYRLCNCPYREVARDSPELVCGLHRGITRGLLDAIDPAARIEEFSPQDPDSAGCLLTLRGGGLG